MSDVMADVTGNIDYVAVDATGRILLTGNIPETMLAIQPEISGVTYVMGKASMTSDYVLNGVITPRPANPTTLSGMQLSNVPNPSTVTIAGGSPTTVTDGEVDLSFTQPGTYDVQVSSWPMLDAVFSVTQS